MNAVRQAHRVEQLRGAIDSGKTQDKVAAPDPAAAPLGSDDEAAGTPPCQDRIALSKRHELERGKNVLLHKLESDPWHRWLMRILPAALFLIALFYAAVR